MNRRIVLIDQQETPDYIKYYCCGLGNEVYTLQSLQNLEDFKLSSIMSIGEGDGVLIVGAEPFKFLKQFYHVGVRSENYYDCSLLYRLSIEGGAFARIVVDFPSDSVISDFLSENFCKKIEYDFKQSIIHTYENSINYINYLNSKPLTEFFGYDYEGSGMALDKWYELSGVSISTLEESRFISFTDVRHEVGSNSEEYRNLLKTLADFTLKRMDHIVVYNMQYEFQVSRRMLGVDLYNLVDASAVNIMDGYHLKKFSLKWTGQRVLGVEVWDAEFDRISDLIDSMLFTIEGKLKRDQHKVLKVDINNFEQTNEWKELCRRYPNYINEFRELIKEYWGNAFMCVPSDILGFYCNRDAFYTLMIFKSRFNSYSPDCWKVNLDNIRLGCRLMSSGLYIDEPFRAKYESYCADMMAWGITYCATTRCFIKMNKHKDLAANIKRYNPVAIKLIKEGQFYQGNSLEIVKNFLINNLDTLDSTDTGLNEGNILIKYGEDFANKFIDLVKESMTETKFKGKIDSSISRKRKILGILSEKIKPLLGLDHIKIGPKHIELEKYMYYERAYEELLKISKKQLSDINNIPKKIYAFGQLWDRKDYADYISDNYFKCKSPEENNEIAYELNKLFPAQTAYLAAMFDSSQQLPETTDFYKSRGILDINQAFSEFIKDWENYYKTPVNVVPESLYPEKTFTLAMQYLKSPVKIKDAKKSKENNTVYVYSMDDRPKEMWTDFNGWVSQAQLFNEFNNQYLDYEKPFEPSDLNDAFFFIRKMNLNYLLYKKYAKLDSTYVGSNGMFKKNNRYVIEGPDRIPLRYADPDEPGAIEKCFVKYQVMEKSSKRWSSAFHTIISHGDCKDVLCPPHTRDVNGNIIYGGSEQLLTYFDISSAEVKAAGFASGDPNLIAKFRAGEDIYIYSAKLYLGEDGWNKLSDRMKKKWRKRFKTIFLGVLYGLGKNSLAERLECSISEADNIIQSLYTSFPQLRHYVDGQGNYPMEHDGYINTMLGDKLRIEEFYKYLPKASDREKNNIIARIKRLGVNLPIQGGTSSIMACGFFNNIRVSKEEGWNMPLQPIIVVHDSNTNYIPVDKIFDMRNFYDTHYTEYCSKIGPGIFLLFDLLAGYSYETAKEMKQIDQDTIEFKGDAYSLIKTYDKLMNCSTMKVECSMTREELVKEMKMITDPMQRFILEQGCNMTKDVSKIKVRFHRIN